MVGKKIVLQSIYINVYDIRIYFNYIPIYASGTVY